MVSNLDTYDKTQASNNMHSEVAKQSRDEILDYLIGTSIDKPKTDLDQHFVSLKQDIDRKQERLSEIKKPKKVDIRKKPETETTSSGLALSLKKLLTVSSKLSLAKFQLVLLFASQINLNDLFSPLKVFLAKLNGTRFNLPAPPKETISDIKQHSKAVIPVIKKIFNITCDLLKTTGELAVEYAYCANDYLVSKYPNYKQTVLSALVLAGCSITTIFNQAAMQNTSHKDELLNAKKLTTVNWNVNGQVNELDRSNIQSLLSTNQIKVIPKSNEYSKDIKLIASTAATSKSLATPDSSFVVINSNTIPHSVNSGESILSISKKYKVSISELISANPASDLINIKAGDVISIPNISEITASTVNEAVKSRKIYSKIPRSLIASRSFSKSFRVFQDEMINSTANMLWPVPQSKTISSRYGQRWGGFHPGIDITAPTGTPIVSTRDGVVSSSGWSGGYGKCIIVDHGNGYSTRYAHASVLLVSPGQRIKAGQVVARIGSTGWSTGPHLHYEVLVNGRHQNPLAYL